MQHMKNMLGLLAQPKATRDEDPKPLVSVGQDKLAGDSLQHKGLHLHLKGAVKK